MNERAKLLHSLTIERADAKVSPPRRRLWPVVAATSFGVIVVMVGLVWYFAPEIASLRPVEQAAAVAPASRPPPSATVPAAEATRSGGLVASGYVVARRKATVASEITGKVVEVLIDEGNGGAGGPDLLARLDSMLAESDLSLAKSRAESRARPPPTRSPPTCATPSGSSRASRRCSKRTSPPRPT